MPPHTDRTYRIATLGCKANAYDSQRLAEALEAIGLRPAPEGEPAAVCVVNTCTVTSVADRKSRQAASRLARENPGARVLVTGCCAAADADEMLHVPGVHGVFGPDARGGLLAAANGVPFEEGALDITGDFGISSFGGRARAFLKIQDGCDSCCSYCILPYVRGRPRSRPLEDIGAEAGRLADAGFAEIVVTGIHVGLYGRDLAGRPSVAQAILAVAETPGVERVRLSSIEPNELDDALLDAMSHPAVCPHLHLPLQSGDADVLRRMNRHYGPDEFLAVVAKVRSRLDRPAVTADVIVGFPGETEEEFENTVRVCAAAEFSRIHVFPFSPRPGTPAADMPAQVPAAVLADRSRRLRELGERRAEQWADGFVGSRVRMLAERHGNGKLNGYTDRYVPLKAPGAPELIGRVLRVDCVARTGTCLEGTISG